MPIQFQSTGASANAWGSRRRHIRQTSQSVGGTPPREGNSARSSCRLVAPIPFKAADGDPVSLLLAILVPQHGDENDHLQLLALVAELFSKPRFRAQIDTGTDPVAIAETFRAGVCELQGS
jgi:hypothetical protein